MFACYIISSAFAISGFIELRSFAFIRASFEKTRSVGADDAGIARMRLATLANTGY